VRELQGLDERVDRMSFAVHFSFSWCLSKPLTVPAGTKAKALSHVNEVERILGLKQVPPGEGNTEAYGPNYPAHWDYFGRDFSKIDEDLLCKTVEDHNAWVRFMYERFEEWAKTPFVPTAHVKESEELTPEDAREFWHGFETITLDSKFWNRDYYRARMESLYEVMRGRDSEGVSWGVTPFEALDEIRRCVDRNMGCNHPTEAECDGEDCIRCFVVGIATAVLEDLTPGPSPANTSGN
jgi:hypothetical protein